MSSLYNFYTPQLEKIHSGKVRDSFRVDEKHRLIVVTDRISCFDHLLLTPVPDKGAVLNGIAAFWFEKLRRICPSHFVRKIDPAASLVREAVPIKIEMVVRGYLTGSAWRAYEQGKRVFSGTELPDGLTRNQRFSTPVLTPTTKEASDREISPEEIVSTGLCSKEMYEAMAETAKRLFAAGTIELASRGIILVDTKYEFGRIDGQLALIDEVHTPDSSRFWYSAGYDENPVKVRSLDKEFVREWLLEHRVGENIQLELPPEVVEEARKRYLEIHQLITGRPCETITEQNEQRESPADRLRRNLVSAGLIKDGYVAIIMGSRADLFFVEKIAKIVESYGIYADVRVVSAHKNGERIREMAEEYNSSCEPGSAIAVAGKSNGLGGALAANLNIPVFNCPPFKDDQDMSINVFSSLMMPSKVPAATIIGSETGAHAALRALNLRRLRERFSKEILLMKETLSEDDTRIRSGRMKNKIDETSTLTRIAPVAEQQAFDRSNDENFVPSKYNAGG
ncbi:MAG: phosphoribosylaminoimidazolesuccinocarboxamide synthase [Candidatus Ozemobacteraceae bacterium]